MKATTCIDVACNDPDSGLFASRAEYIQLMDGEIELERYLGVRFTELSGGIRIHRRRFQIEASKDWVGNWCWNRYAMTRDEAKKFFATLRDNGWQCTTGPTHFYNWWNRKGRFAQTNE
ncbi:hypothetical protein [Roseibium sp. Sym1]|uniref:hypothetical protein n=1 Tax=Roseibium sp. Sym1 TaxID=3016006 RepID=UPI0022B343F3|nr:hypothetical protein [Roseibium sp. Sym1]